MLYTFSERVISYGRDVLKITGCRYLPLILQLLTSSTPKQGNRQAGI